MRRSRHSRLIATKVRAAAQSYTWETTARLFLDNVERALFRNRGRPVPARHRAVFAG